MYWNLQNGAKPAFTEGALLVTRTRITLGTGKATDPTDTKSLQLGNT